MIKADEIPVKHHPTLSGEVSTIKIGKLNFELWDFAGQEEFSYLWNSFIKGSDGVLLITDSTLENVEHSKFFLELIKEQAPHAISVVIGNKQDLPNALSSEKIKKMYDLKTFPMVAVDTSNRDKMIQIISNLLEINTDVSPLIKPFLRRNELIITGTKALEDHNFTRAVMVFEQISDLSLELGDYSLSKQYNDKAKYLKEKFIDR